MSEDITTSESVANVRGYYEQFVHWVVLDGSRAMVGSLMTAVIILVFFAVTSLHWLAIGPNSSAATAFASGLISGTVTLVTIALSINQLILSRVFGSPNELSNQLQGTSELRDRVRDHAEEPVLPNDPASFLGVLSRTLATRANRLSDAVDDAPAVADEVESFAESIAAYGENIDDHVEHDRRIVDVLDVIMGTEYAQNMTAAENVRNRYGESLPQDARVELLAIDDLLEAVAVTRQFFKTLALQQDFAHLSRFVAYSGMLALVASIMMALIYTKDAVTVPESLLPVVFAVGIGVIVAPLAVFIAYVFRAATIARHTVSVGPFVPPQERTD